MNEPTLHQTYQATPYPSRPVTLSHPNHLYVVGRLHGLTPVEVTGARVLELGCGAGGNLAPMAVTLPDSHFTGIDLSERQIEMAREMARGGRLTNIEFQAGDALSLLADTADGAYDYIILHGLYSWVPLAVQAELLPLCGRLLSAHGIAYVSYNTYPGWHGRSLIRDVMLHASAGVADLADPGQQISAARQALDDLIGAYAQTDDAYAKLLREEKARVEDMDDSFLLHDLLEVENHPVYLNEFMARADRAGLRFISEGNVAASREENFSPDARRQLAGIGDTIAREQQIDFMLNRSFRQTLLCRGNGAVQRDIDPSWLIHMHLASPLRPMGPDANGAPGEAFFATPDGGRIGMTAPNAIAALNYLAVAWPEFLPFPDLAGTVGGRDGDGAIVAQLAIDLYPRNWLDLLPHPPLFTKTPGDRPLATQLARWQVRQGEMVTDQRHRNVSITDGLTRQLLPLLDGVNDRAMLQRAVMGFERDANTLVTNDDPLAALDAALHQLAERCLLVQ